MIRNVVPGGAKVPSGITVESAITLSQGNSWPSVGSGLYVGQTGVAVDHHFLLSVNPPPYEFTAGEIGVSARLVGKPQPVKLTEASVYVTEEHALVLAHLRMHEIRRLPSRAHFNKWAAIRSYCPRHDAGLGFRNSSSERGAGGHADNQLLLWYCYSHALA